MTEGIYGCFGVDNGIHFVQQEKSKEPAEQRIVQYIRSRRGKNRNQPVGVIIARRVDNKVKIGWSLCRRGDLFSKKIAREIADSRIDKGTDAFVPHEVESLVMNGFGNRASRYFRVPQNSVEITGS
jgi:hypothetical protein